MSIFTPKGERLFHACNNKVVEVKDFVYVDGKEGKKVRSGETSNDTRIYAGSCAVLHCPRTEDGRVDISSQYTNHSSRLEAYASLREIAGAMVCSGCIYAQMSPVGVAQERAERLQAQAFQLEALAARERALAELQAINPDFQLPATGEMA